MFDLCIQGKDVLFVTRGRNGHEHRRREEEEWWTHADQLINSFVCEHLNCSYTRLKSTSEETIFERAGAEGGVAM